MRGSVKVLALVVGLDVRVKSDMQLGVADPLAGRTTRHVSADERTPVNYATVPRKKFTLDFVAPPDTGQRGLYVEVDAGRGVFFTTNLAVFASLTAGRPSYARDYAPYASDPPAVAITH